jgi:hypothetical protein
MPHEPDPPAASGEQRELLARLRAVVEAKDAENAMLRAELGRSRVTASVVRPCCRRDVIGAVMVLDRPEIRGSVAGGRVGATARPGRRPGTRA